MTAKRPPVSPSSRSRQPDPPPEVFKRTAEEERAARARLDAEVADMKARGVSPELERAFGPDAPTHVSKAAIFSRLDELRERAERWQDERRSLTCWRAVHPSGPPDGFAHADLAPGRVLVGYAACRDAGARDACAYKVEHPTCLWQRAEGNYERAHRNLSAGLQGEAEDEHKLMLAAIRLDDPRPLRDTDPLSVIRLWLGAGVGRTALADGAQVDPLTGQITHECVVELRGGERLLVLGGNPGRGKTVAGISAIARKGGMYALEYSLMRPCEVDPLVAAAGVLVVDQLQPTDADEARRAARRLDEIVHRRFAAGRRTLLIGNVDWLTFARRYGEVSGGKVKHAGIIAERCSQAGAFILFGGESLRKEMA